MKRFIRKKEREKMSGLERRYIEIQIALNLLNILKENDKNHIFFD